METLLVTPNNETDLKLIKIFGSFKVFVEI